MKTFVKAAWLLVLLCNQAAVFAQNNSAALLVEIRQNLRSAFKDESVCNGLYEKVKNLKTTDPLLKGYAGAVHIARSKHVSVINKMSNFNKGKDLLEEAVRARPGELELHFLRLTIQYNLPGFLGYKSNIDADKKFVLDHFGEAGPNLKERITNYVKTSGHFTPAEQNRIAN